MAYTKTIPCELSTGPKGLITGQTPLAAAGLGCAGDCHCGGTCGGHGAAAGLGDISTGSLMALAVIGFGVFVLSKGGR